MKSCGMTILYDEDEWEKYQENFTGASHEGRPVRFPCFVASFCVDGSWGKTAYHIIGYREIAKELVENS